MVLLLVVLVFVGQDCHFVAYPTLDAELRADGGQAQYRCTY